jgi:hypothetical protein
MLFARLTLHHRPERVIQQHHSDAHWRHWTRATGIGQVNISGHGVRKIKMHSKQQQR